MEGRPEHSTVCLVNAGGSSVKLSVRCPALRQSVSAALTRIGLRETVVQVTYANGESQESATRTGPPVLDTVQAGRALWGDIEAGMIHLGMPDVRTVAHRVVFAGALPSVAPFSEAVAECVRGDMHRNPIHAQRTLALWEVLREQLPEAAHVCVPDSIGFGSDLSPHGVSHGAVARYGLLGPGRHGLAMRAGLREVCGQEPNIGTTLSVHVGSGVSVGYFRDWTGVYSSMTTSALEGPVMNRRPGNLRLGTVLEIAALSSSLHGAIETLSQSGGIYALSNQPELHLTVDDLVRGGYDDGAYLRSLVATALEAVRVHGSPDRVIVTGGNGTQMFDLLRPALETVLAPLTPSKPPAVHLARGDEFGAMLEVLAEERALAPIRFGVCVYPGTYHGPWPSNDDGQLRVVPLLSPAAVLAHRAANALLAYAGDETSHGAALARSLRVPTGVVECKAAQDALRTGRVVAVDITNELFWCDGADGRVY